MIHTSPCLGCELRQPGCHSKCEKGIEHSKQLKAKRESVKAAKSYEDMINNYKITQITKTKAKCGMK